MTFYKDLRKKKKKKTRDIRSYAYSLIYIYFSFGLVLLGPGLNQVQVCQNEREVKKQKRKEISTHLANAGWSSGDNNNFSSNIFAENGSINVTQKLGKPIRRQKQEEGNQGSRRSYNVQEAMNQIQLHGWGNELESERGV